MDFGNDEGSSNVEDRRGMGGIGLGAGGIGGIAAGRTMATATRKAR